MKVFKVTKLNFYCRKCGGLASPFFVPAKDMDDFWKELKEDKVFCIHCITPSDLVEEIGAEVIIDKCISEAFEDRKRNMN
jgi:hypothetical protein